MTCFFIQADVFNFSGQIYVLQTPAFNEVSDWTFLCARMIQIANARGRAQQFEKKIKNWQIQNTKLDLTH